MATPIFPKYLNQGSKGGAVNMLGALLKAAGLDQARGRKRVPRIVLDGEYTRDGAIAAAVRRFQRRVGFKGKDVDGNFGPMTRRLFLEHYNINVDTLTIEMFAAPTTAVSPEETAT